MMLIVIFLRGKNTVIRIEGMSPNIHSFKHSFIHSFIHSTYWLRFILLIHSAFHQFSHFSLSFLFSIPLFEIPLFCFTFSFHSLSLLVLHWIFSFVRVSIPQFNLPSFLSLIPLFHSSVWHSSLLLCFLSSLSPLALFSFILLSSRLLLTGGMRDNSPLCNGCFMCSSALSQSTDSRLSIPRLFSRHSCSYR